MEKIHLDIEAILKKHDPENKLSSYIDILKIENEKLNLVSRETIASKLPQLIAESLLPLGYIEQNKITNYLDIGSGGGLPSFPILLAQKIENVTLTDRIGKKADSLQRMVDYCGLDNIEVINRQLEECKFENKFDLITMRLVKLNNRLLTKILKIMHKNSIFIYYHKPEFVFTDNSLSVVTYSYSTGPNSVDKYFSLIAK